MTTPTLPAQGVKSRAELAQLLESAYDACETGEEVLRALSDAGVVLVPSEPTKEMLDHVVECTIGYRLIETDARKVWRLMLAALTEKETS